jgi:hypothetical protein
MQFMHISSGTEIWDRNALNRGFRQEKEPDGGVYCLGETLDLIECRLFIAALPAIEFREWNREILNCPACTLAGPAQQFRFDGHVNYRGTFLHGIRMRLNSF